MISVKEALNIVLSVHKSYGTEKIELADATSRTLAEDIIADQDFPPFNRVAMDGIAIVYFDNVMPYYPIESRVNAGDVPVPIQSPGNCIEVMTGASLPDGCNCVVPFEHIEKFDDYYTINQNPKAWQNIHKQGQDAKQGNVLLKKGNQINAGNISIIGSCGYTQVLVEKQPKIAMITTGNELVDVAEKPLPHQIRRTNNLLINSILKRIYLTAQHFHLEDDEVSLLNALEKLSNEYDVIISSGAVSAGKKDYIPAVLDKIGATTHFHKVNQKPGKPFLFASINRATYFGLPGNPMSTMVCALRYLVPFLGGSFNAGSYELNHDIEPFSKTRFIPVVRNNNQISVLKTNGSGDLVSVKDAFGFIEIADNQTLNKGELVPVISLGS